MRQLEINNRPLCYMEVGEGERRRTQCLPHSREALVSSSFQECYYKAISLSFPMEGETIALSLMGTNLAVSRRPFGLRSSVYFCKLVLSANPQKETFLRWQGRTGLLFLRCL